MENIIRKTFLYFFVLSLSYNIVFLSRYIKVPVNQNAFQIERLSLGEHIFNIVRYSIIFTVIATITTVAVYYFWKKYKLNN